MHRLARTAMVIALCGQMCDVQAQAIHKKHLLMMLGTGLASVNLQSDTAVMDLRTTCGVVDFGFRYAITDRFSLGAHYQRLGKEAPSPELGNLRITCYQIEGAWHFHIRERNALSATLAIGAALLDGSTPKERLPLEARTGLLTFGCHYDHLWSAVIGTYAAVELSPTGKGTIYRGDEPVPTPFGNAASVSWVRAAITIGLLVRF